MGSGVVGSSGFVPLGVVTNHRVVQVISRVGRVRPPSVYRH